MVAQVNKLAAGIQKWWTKNIVFITLMGATLFLASGKFNWGTAWIYLCCIFAIVIVNAMEMDPSLLAERSELQEGTKKWDVALASFVAICGPLLIWLLAGLDIRFGWSHGFTPPVQIAAFVFVVLGGLLGAWSMATNKFFSATVRIQMDRNHKVVTHGPYQCIRHPGYAGGMLSMLVTPLALGSWAALLPAVLVICGYIVRTALEDAVLQEELEGYIEYANKVHYRLFPGIW